LDNLLKIQERKNWLFLGVLCVFYFAPFARNSLSAVHAKSAKVFRKARKGKITS
jgi:hypothetical protein